MGEASGFSWSRRKNGDVIVEHHGRQAVVLRGSRADDFILETASGDEQEAMARVTGNYKRGNERQARNHRRNR